MENKIDDAPIGHSEICPRLFNGFSEKRSPPRSEYLPVSSLQRPDLRPSGKLRLAAVHAGLQLAHRFWIEFLSGFEWFLMGGGKLWGLLDTRKDGFLKGYRFQTKADANRRLSEITNQKRDPITNWFRYNVYPKEIPKELHKKIMEPSA